MGQNIRNNFLKDKQALENTVSSYLNGKAAPVIDAQQYRGTAKAHVQNGNWLEAIRNLEHAHDAKKGIACVTMQSGDGTTPIVLRDARHCDGDSVFEGIEAAEMTLLAHFEAAKDVLDFEGKTTHPALHEMANAFFDNFAHHHEGQSSEDIFAISREHIGQIAGFLKNCGISQASKKLNQALHFQNFKQEKNHNPVTISSIMDDEDVQHTVIESDVAFKGLTPHQKTLYDRISAGNAVSPLQKNLMKKYKPQIFSGEFVIPAQLIDCVPGIRNAFEETTYLITHGTQDMQAIDVRKRSGALPTLLKDESLTAQVSKANANQASFLMSDRGEKLHWNSLNTDVPVLGPVMGGKTESAIARNSHIASKSAGITFSTTPINKFRKIGVTEMSDMKDYVKQLSDAIKPASKAQLAVKEYLNPPGFLQKIKRIFQPLPSINKAINLLEQDGKDANLMKILTSAVALKKGLNQSASTFQMTSSDSENNNLQTSVNFSRLTHLVNEGMKDRKSDFASFCHVSRVPRKAIVNSCKSGKDRTGLNMLYRMTKALQQEIGCSFGKISNQLHLSGHTEGLPGSVMVGGGTAGCYQLQEPVLHAIPRSEQESLTPIVGPFAHNNKAFKKGSGKTGKANVKTVEEETAYFDEASSETSEESLMQENKGPALHNPVAEQLIGEKFKSR